VTYTFTKGKSSIAIGSSSDEVGAVAINGHLILVPVGHAQRIAEALTGRTIAAIVYEDELPEVEAHDDESLVSVSGYGYHDAHSAEGHTKVALRNIAIARHIEARDAAAKEVEREREERVAQLADDLRPVVLNASVKTEGGIVAQIDAIALAAARHVLDSAQGAPDIDTCHHDPDEGGEFE
jgi:ribosomal protein S9